MRAEMGPPTPLEPCHERSDDDDRQNFASRFSSSSTLRLRYKMTHIYRSTEIVSVHGRAKVARWSEGKLNQTPGHVPTGERGRNIYQTDDVLLIYCGMYNKGIHEGGTVLPPSAHILPLSAPGGRTCSSARIRNLATTVIFASLLVGGERASPECTLSRTILGIQTTWYHIPLYFVA